MLSKDCKGYLRQDGRLVHRIVWEEAFGQIPEGWVVHHCDGSKLNNDLDNLVALPKKYHTKLHADVRRLNIPLPRREELLHVYRAAREELATALAAFVQVRAQYERLRLQLEKLGVDTSRIRSSKQKKKRKNRGWTKLPGKPKPRAKTLLTGDRSADKARLKEIQQLRANEIRLRKAVQDGC